MNVELNDVLLGCIVAAVVTTGVLISTRFVLTSEAAKIAFTIYKYSEQLVDAGQERLTGQSKRDIAELLTIVLIKKYPLLHAIINVSTVQSVIDWLVSQANQKIDESQEVISTYLQSKI